MMVVLLPISFARFFFSHSFKRVTVYLVFVMNYRSIFSFRGILENISQLTVESTGGNE